MYTPAPRNRNSHKQREVIYGAKEQLAPEDDTTLPLESQGTKRVQVIVRALLYYCLFDLNEMFDLLHTFTTKIMMLMGNFSMSNP